MARPPLILQSELETLRERAGITAGSSTDSSGSEYPIGYAEISYTVKSAHCEMDELLVSAPFVCSEPVARVGCSFQAFFKSFGLHSTRLGRWLN
jgi:hypothetical protein